MATGRELKGGGRLVQEESCGQIRFCVTRPRDERGLYKVWIWGGGGRMLLGTMMPQEGMLQLRRTVSRNALCAAGCYPVLGGEIVMAFPFGEKEMRQKSMKNIPMGWQREEKPERWISDALIQKEVEGKPCLMREENGILLAQTYMEGKEFPLIPLFCLCQWVRLDGVGYLVWKFDENGRPIFGDKL